MSSSTTLTIRIDHTVKERLEALATSTKRSKSYLAAEAIVQFVDSNEWQVAQTEKAVEEADAGGPFVSHEDMTAWLSSWGTEDELPPPEPRIQRK